MNEWVYVCKMVVVVSEWETQAANFNLTSSSSSSSSSLSSLSSTSCCVFLLDLT